MDANKYKFYPMVRGPHSLWQPGDELRYEHDGQERRLVVEYPGGRPERGQQRESFVWRVLQGEDWVVLGEATGPAQIERLLRLNLDLPETSGRNSWAAFTVWHADTQTRESLNDMRGRFAAAFAPAAAAAPAANAANAGPAGPAAPADNDDDDDGDNDGNGDGNGDNGHDDGYDGDDDHTDTDADDDNDP